MRGLDWTRDAPRFPGPSERLRAGGVDWRVMRRGERGPEILLLHGAGASAHSWDEAAADLAEDHRVTAPDLPGHAFSSAGPPSRQGLPAMAAALAQLLATLEVSPRLIAGHSAGAAVALRLTLDGAAAPAAIFAVNGALAPFRGLAGVLFPPMAKALALNPFTPRAFAAAMGADPLAAGRLIRGTGSTAPRRSMAFYRRLFATPAHVDGALRMMAQWDLEPMLAELPSLPCPLILSVGGKDRAVPPDEAERLAARLPFARLERHADLGHLMHEEAPERFAARIRALAENPASEPAPAAAGAEASADPTETAETAAETAAEPPAGDAA